MAVAIIVAWQAYTILAYIYAAHKGYARFTALGSIFSIAVYAALVGVLFWGGLADTWQGMVLIGWWIVNSISAVAVIGQRIEVTPGTAARCVTVSIALIALMLSLA